MYVIYLSIIVRYINIINSCKIDARTPLKKKHVVIWLSRTGMHMILLIVGFPSFFIFLVFLDTSMDDGMLMDDHGSPDFKRMVSVVTQQSEVTNEQDTAGQEQAPENKIIEDETMELGRVRFFQNHFMCYFKHKFGCLIIITRKQ